MTGLIKFSKDAASNDVAAPPILWTEGQPANTFNNSARAMMAALACWHADNTGGVSASGGASNALSVASAQGFTAADLQNWFRFTFFVDAANTGPCTLNIDGSGAKPLRRPGNFEMAPGDLQPAVPYDVIWAPGLGLYLVVSPGIIRPGKYAEFASYGAVPPGWLICDGSSLSRSTYSALFQAIGTNYGAPDGNTFTLPDRRGRSSFGDDRGAGRLSGLGGVNGTVGSTGGVEAVKLTADQMPNHTHGGSTGGAGGHDHGGSTGQSGAHDHGGSTNGAGGHTHGASTGTAGAHQHTGTTAIAGSHGHPIPYSVGTAGSGSTNRAVNDLNPNGTANAGGATTLGGDHQHDFTTAASGDHSHGVTVAAVGDHAHGIPGASNHTHGITGVGDHAHGLTISASGGDQFHSNMPPALVVVVAIKA